MPYALVLGGGQQGSFIALKLGEWGIDTTVWETSLQRLEELQQYPFIKAERKNFLTDERINDEIKKYDVVVEALPGKLGFTALKKLASLGKKVVSVSFMEEDYLQLHELARENDSTIIPDCGFTPGISNLLVGNGLSRAGVAEKITILVGGLPLNPTPPFYHNLTWSVEDLIEEYRRPARVKKNGIIREVRPFSDIRREIGFPVQDLVSFPTDGLRSLLKTTNVPEMEERTLRYSKHVEKVKVLDELGFFGENSIDLMGISYPTKFLTAKIIEQNFLTSSEEDIILSKIEIKSPKIIYTYEITGEYDYERGISAMRRATGTPAAVFAKFFLEKDIVQTGVVPLEYLGDREDILYKTIQELKKEGIIVKEKKKTL